MIQRLPWTCLRYITRNFNRRFQGQITEPVETLKNTIVVLSAVEITGNKLKCQIAGICTKSNVANWLLGGDAGSRQEASSLTVSPLCRRRGSRSDRAWRRKRTQILARMIPATSLDTSEAYQKSLFNKRLRGQRNQSAETWSKSVIVIPPAARRSVIKLKGRTR